MRDIIKDFVLGSGDETIIEKIVELHEENTALKGGIPRQDTVEDFAAAADEYITDLKEEIRQQAKLIKKLKMERYL